jgi:hypothetical protein
MCPVAAPPAWAAFIRKKQSNRDHAHAETIPSAPGQTTATVSVLEREMFSEAEAARLLRVPQSTLHYWPDGGEYRRKTYKPVIRLQPRGDRLVNVLPCSTCSYPIGGPCLTCAAFQDDAPFLTALDCGSGGAAVLRCR